MIITSHLKNNFLTKYDDAQSFFTYEREQATHHQFCAYINQQTYLIAKAFHQAIGLEAEFTQTFLSPTELFAKSPVIINHYRTWHSTPTILLIDFLPSRCGYGISIFFNHWLSRLKNDCPADISQDNLQNDLYRHIHIHFGFRRNVPLACSTAQQSCINYIHQNVDSATYIALSCGLHRTLQALYQPDHAIVIDSPLIVPKEPFALNQSSPLDQNPHFIYTSFQYYPEITLPRIFRFSDGHLLIACLQFKPLGRQQTVVIPYIFSPNPSSQILHELSDSLLYNFCQTYHFQPNRVLSHHASFQHTVNLLDPKSAPIELPYHSTHTSLDPLLDQLYQTEVDLQSQLYFATQYQISEEEKSKPFLPTAHLSISDYVTHSSNPHNAASQICYLLSTHFAELHAASPQFLLPTERALFLKPLQFFYFLDIANSIAARSQYYVRDFNRSLELYARQNPTFAENLHNTRFIISALKNIGFEIQDYQKGLDRFRFNTTTNDPAWDRAASIALIKQVRALTTANVSIEEMFETLPRSEWQA